MAFALPRGIVLLLAVLAAITFLVEGAILDWSALLLIDQGLVAEAQGGLGYMIFAIAMLTGRFTGDWVVGRLGGRRILLWGGLVTLAGFLVLPHLSLGHDALLSRCEAPPGASIAAPHGRCHEWAAPDRSAARLA